MSAAAAVASLALLAGLISLSAQSTIPLVVKVEFPDFDDATIWPLEEIAPDTRQYIDVEPRILYQIGVSTAEPKEN